MIRVKRIIFLAVVYHMDVFLYDKLYLSQIGILEG
jgi:hypothetical protein